MRSSMASTTDRSVVAPGTMVTEGIRLVRALKGGGMGSVWLAENVHLGAPVVVKFMSGALSKDAAALARFSREAQLAARIRSPHVVQIFDCRVGEPAAPFLVMEHLEGEDLGARLDRGRLSPEETAEIVVHVARALAAAHAQGVVHRDVKPENVFLIDAGGGKPFAKLLDFGIAKDTSDGAAAAADLTSIGATMGTPHYMSPEQMLAPKDVDGRCDLWALAVVAFACVTGRVPFEGETFGALVMKIHNGEYPRASMLVTGLPEGIDAWFSRAFHLDLEQRFATAREMSDALLDVVYTRRARSSGERLAGAAARAREREPSFSEEAAAAAERARRARRKAAAAHAAVAPRRRGGGRDQHLRRRPRADAPRRRRRCRRRPRRRAAHRLRRRHHARGRVEHRRRRRGRRRGRRPRPRRATPETPLRTLHHATEEAIEPARAQERPRRRRVPAHRPDHRRPPRPRQPARPGARAEAREPHAAHPPPRREEAAGQDLLTDSRARFTEAIANSGSRGGLPRVVFVVLRVEWELLASHA
jgi:serine/threonine-protein kinase